MKTKLFSLLVALGAISNLFARYGQHNVPNIYRVSTVYLP